MRAPLVLLLVVAAAAGAQTPAVIIDQGVFDITRDDVPVATETFHIVQPRGTRTLHTYATLIPANDSQRVVSDLYSDTLGTPVTPNAAVPAYALTVMQGKVRLYRLDVRTRPGRLSGLSTDAQNDQRLQEYVLRPGTTIIADPEFVHQLYFAAIGGRTGALLVVAPHTGRSSVDTVVAHGADSVQINGHAVSARRYTIGSGINERAFWVDHAGRLLRVDIPAQSIVALRQEAPPG